MCRLLFVAVFQRTKKVKERFKWAGLSDAFTTQENVTVTPTGPACVMLQKYGSKIKVSTKSTATR